MADRLGPYREKRDFAATPEPPPGRARGVRRRALRGAGAQRPRDALGPPARARGHARLVGRAEGDPGRSQAQPPRRAHGGSPARVPGLPRRHPRGLLRRGDDARVGPRHLRAAQVPRGRGDGHLPRRAARGSLRAVPHRRQELDDPPDGPAAGRRSRADAGAHRADARALGQAPARGRPLGLRGQVGRRAGDRLRRGRAAAAGEPDGPRHHAALPGAARARAGAGVARGGARRRGGGVRAGRAAQLPAPPEPHAPGLRQRRAAARRPATPSPT